MQQKGQSRLWFKDHRWWVAVVEFQPSSWSRGSYLNVAAMWLWNAKDYWSFDYGGRVGGFTAFKSEDQFASAADQIAEAARDEVLVLEKLFDSEAVILQRLRGEAGASIWSSFHVFCCELAAGRVDAASDRLATLMKYAPSHAWIESLQRQAIRMLDDAQRSGDPRSPVTAEVLNARQLLKLPPLEPSAIWTAS
jgi:hypothetical protein